MNVLEVESDGPRLRTEDDAVELIGEALGVHADWVAIPMDRLDDDFFDLSTRLAGHFVQKFVNYRLRLAIVGDISRHTARSAALGDFIGEANRGDQLWFVADREELDRRLAE